MTKKILLIEIGTEELPARLLSKISLCFYQNFAAELKSYNISYEDIKSFSTPRRLALKIINIDTIEKIIEINKRGPSIIDSYNHDGSPTRAANRWAEYCGINVNQADHLKTNKGEWLSCTIRKKQEKIELLIPKITEKSLKKIPIHTSMRWEIQNKKFFRPIRNIVMLLDDKVIKGKVFNIISTKFLHSHIALKEEKITIKNSKEYPLILLKKNNIIADYQIRKQTIIQKINKIAYKINGLIKINSFLIEEITSLVESPTVLLATFNNKFLKIPKKILVHTIEKHQKCFPIYNLNKDLLPYFIFISNINSQKPKNIIIGNEKVMHARLSDAEFFFYNDRKNKLEDCLPSLKKVVFQKKLGSLYEKTCRLKLLIQWIAQYNNSNIQDSIRAAILSKCDLITNMVCEFPELQGIIGMYYALGDKEKKDVAIAIKEQYLPSFSGDKIPHTLIGCSLSIADKIDTLSGMFSIGKIPNSDKDPFALRRLTIGILRIIINKNISLDLKDLIDKSLSLYNIKNIDTAIICDKIINFFIKRLFYWYEEIGYNNKIIQSVFSIHSTQPININQRIQAIDFFQKLDNSKLMLLLIKRISNILEKEQKKITKSINIQLIKKTEEIVLLNQIKDFHTDTKKLFIENKYKEIILIIKNFEKPIHNFFNKVRIYDSNAEISINRLILLNELNKIFSKIANFSYLY